MRVKALGIYHAGMIAVSDTVFFCFLILFYHAGTIAVSDAVRVFGFRFKIKISDFGTQGLVFSFRVEVGTP